MDYKWAQKIITGKNLVLIILYGILKLVDLVGGFIMALKNYYTGFGPITIRYRDTYSIGDWAYNGKIIYLDIMAHMSFIQLLGIM